MSGIFSAGGLGAFLMTGSGANSNWSITGFLSNLNGSLEVWGQLIVVAVGLVMLIVAVFKIAKGLMSGGRGQVNWVLNVLLFFIGGALCFGGGWGLLKDISSGGASTLEQLGTGSGGIPSVIIMIPGMDANGVSVTCADGTMVYIE